MLKVNRAKNEIRIKPIAWNAPQTYNASITDLINAAIMGNYFFASGTAARSAMGASLNGANKWYGGVLGPDGKIYGIPVNATDILIIDPVAGTATRSAMGASLGETNKWIGGVLGSDGKIYGIPYNATDILIIDPVAGKFNANLLLSGYLNKF